MADKRDLSGFLVFFRRREITWRFLIGLAVFFLSYNALIYGLNAWGSGSDGGRSVVSGNVAPSEPAGNVQQGGGSGTSADGLIQARCVGNGVRVRSGMNMYSDANVLARLDAGDSILIERAYDNGWYAVRYGDGTAYVFAAFVVASQQTGMAAGEVYGSAAGRASASVSAPVVRWLSGKIVLIGDSGSGWFQGITADGIRFFVHQNDFHWLR